MKFSNSVSTYCHRKENKIKSINGMDVPVNNFID